MGRHYLGHALTEREETLLNVLCGGKRLTEAASVLGVSPSRVNNMMAVVRDKLGARTNMEAAVLHTRRTWQ